MLKFLLPLSMALFMAVSAPKGSWHTVTHMSLVISFFSVLIIFNPLLDAALVTPLFERTSLSALLVVLTFIFLPLMLLASYKIYHNKVAPTMFLIMTIILTMVLAYAFTSTSTLVFYIMFEFALIPTALLVILWGYQPERLNATIYLLLYTISFSFPLLIMLLYYYNIYYTTSFSVLLYNSYFSSHFPLLMTFALIAAFLAKLPMFLIHLWLPKAHVEAPIAGSMILAGVLLKLGIYGLLKIIPLTSMYTTSLPKILIALSILGMISTSLVCLQQTDIKSLIAYSSVVHMALVLAAIMTGVSCAWDGALMMAIAHGLASSALFMLANCSYNYTQSRNLFLMKGFLTTAPSLTMCWFLFLCLNLAAPPSLNFASELLLISSLINYSYFLMFLLAVTIVLSAAYSLMLFATTQHGQLSAFTLPHFTILPTNLMTLMLHFLPLILLVLSPNLLLMS